MDLCASYHASEVRQNHLKKKTNLNKETPIETLDSSISKGASRRNRSD